MANLMNFTLRQLRYVTAVVEHGSISAAAERLGISQPAISSVLSDIEENYNVSLFVRERPHRIIPTSLGRQFVANAKNLLEQAEEFDSDARSLSKTLKGSIELGCFLPTAPFVLPIILERLKKDYPDIEIKLFEADIDEIITLNDQTKT